MSCNYVDNIHAEKYVEYLLSLFRVKFPYNCTALVLLVVHVWDILHVLLCAFLYNCYVEIFWWHGCLNKKLLRFLLFSFTSGLLHKTSSDSIIPFIC